MSLWMRGDYHRRSDENKRGGGGGGNGEKWTDSRNVYAVQLAGLGDILTGKREVWRMTHGFLS